MAIVDHGNSSSQRRTSSDVTDGVPGGEWNRIKPVCGSKLYGEPLLGGIGRKGSSSTSTTSRDCSERGSVMMAFKWWFGSGLIHARVAHSLRKLDPKRSANSSS